MVSHSAPSGASESLHKNNDEIALSKNCILTLPTELLTMTLENLNQEDLGMVRRTCKTLCNVATLPFARKMPTVRRFRFVKEDMDRLIGLTAHPIFGRMLSCISLSTCRLVQVDETRLLKESQRLFRLRELTNQPSGILLSKEEEHMNHYWQIHDHNEAQEVQSKFFMRGLHIRSLTQALLNLKMCCNFDVTLGLYDHDDLTQLLMNLPALEFLRPGPGKEDDFACTLQVLKAAIDMSQFPVKTLNLELRGNHLAEIEINKQDLFWLRMQPVPDVRIEITCCEATSFRELSWSKSQIKMTGHNLGPTDELLTECDGGPSWLENEHSQLWDHVYYNKYQEAILTDIFADYDVLEGFVRSSAFRHLTIRDCGLSQQEDAFLDGTKSDGLTLCRKLKSLASLESLVLEKIWDHANEEWIQEEPVRWTGQEQIHAGLDKLLADMSEWEWNWED
ncbi:hypothetical protein D6D28_10359 [Aureobasidium pullulans]|uniref:F-box domain-containing protein n=1 Tax=Aureobasidium pullulans TaxID=5580 RepID=A0A4V4HY90_AURPU|nr:hypothetical protein D6D28_10359 [Aureobasidium pullulans]